MEVPEEPSPISNREYSIANSVDSGKSTEALIKVRSPTNMSDQLIVSGLIPVKQDSSSLERKRRMTTTNNWTRAAVWAGIIRRSRSMPDLNISLESNCLVTKIGNGASNVNIGPAVATRRRLFSLLNGDFLGI